MRRLSESATAIVFSLVGMMSTAFALDPGPGFRAALAARSPARHRAAIVALVAQGDIHAASRLIDLGLWDETRTLPADALAAWRTSDERADGRLARQIVAVIEANRAARKLSGDAKRDALRAMRDVLRDPEPTDYALLLELAWLEGDVESKNGAAASRLAERAIELLGEQPGRDADPLVGARSIDVHASALRYLGDEASACSRALPELDEAARRYAAVEDPSRQGRALVNAARCAMPSVTSSGSWAGALDRALGAIAACDTAKNVACVADAQWRAGRILGHKDNPDRDLSRATRAYIASGASYAALDQYDDAGFAFKAAAYAARPDKNPQGSWGAAIDNYEKAVVQFMAGKNRHMLARTYAAEADALSSKRNPDCEFVKSAALYEQAAELAESLEEWANAADDLVSLTVVLSDAKPPADIERRLAVTARALDLARRSGDHEILATALHWRGATLGPDRNPKGSCLRAIPFFEESEHEAAISGNAIWQAHELQWIAWCLQPVHNPAVRDWSAAISKHGQAVDVARDSHDAYTEADARDMLARALQPDKNPNGSLTQALEEWQRAAELFERDGATLRQGHVLTWLGFWSVPTRNPNGGWDRCASYYAKAAKLYKSMKTQREETYASGMRAVCLCRSDDPALKAEGLADAADVIRRRCGFDRADAAAIAAACSIEGDDPPCL